MSTGLPPMPTERHELLETPDGLLLDARVAGPAPAARGRAVICHPHPLHGGTMDNKVVTTCARAAAAAQLATVRFNFRGVGESEGKHEEGQGERLDVRAALRHADRQVASGLRVLLGFSFGAAMSTQVVAEGELVDLLVLVGLPLATMTIARPPLPARGLLLLCGDRDSFCPLDAARSYIAAFDDPRARLQVITGAEHLFHGHLDELGRAVATTLQPAR